MTHPCVVCLILLHLAIESKKEVQIHWSGPSSRAPVVFLQTWSET